MSKPDPKSSTLFQKIVRIAIVASILIGAGALTWRKVVRDHVVPRNFGIVEAGEVLRSGRLTPRMLRAVCDENDIKTVIDFGAFAADSEKEATEQRICEEMGVDRVVLRLRGDGSGNPNHYVQAMRMMMDEEHQPILVHCAAGAQRTGAAVVMYRHIVDGWSIEDAYREATQYKHDPADDWPMLAYVAEWIGPIKTALDTGGWVEGFDHPEQPLALQE